MSRSPHLPLPKILLTGGAGFVGSHTAVRLIEAGFLPVIYDNLSTGSRRSVDRIQAIAGVRPLFVEGDICDVARLDAALARHPVVAAIHCAGLRSVTGSIAHPSRAHATNVAGTQSLCSALARRGIKRLVFSSSAAVYGESDGLPLSEGSRLSPASPYGWTKLLAEQMLGALAASDPAWRVVVLRPFNVGGAHESCGLGELADENAECLLMRLALVASGLQACLDVFGGDYPTPDGTALRDYIHVEDVAAAHVAALQSVLSPSAGRELTLNVGSGWAASVLDVVRTFERVSGRPIALRRRERRAGDIASSCADVSKAAVSLDWRPARNLEAICRDAWRWHERGEQAVRARVFA